MHFRLFFYILLFFYFPPRKATHTRVSLAPSLYSIFSYNKNSTKFKKFFEIRYIEERTQQQNKGAEKTKKKKQHTGKDPAVAQRSRKNYCRFLRFGDLGLHCVVICLLNKRVKIGFLRKNSGQFEKLANLPTVTLQTHLWLFAIATDQLPHDLVDLLCIWKSDFSSKRVCNALPNMLFGFLVRKHVFWLKKVEPNMH